MEFTVSFRRRWLAAVAVLVAGCAPESGVAPRLAPKAPALGKGHLSPVVISQVYGAGGNSGSPAATYNADFVELYNPSASAVSLAGWSVQYASATGTGAFGGTASQLVALSGSIAPGGYYLVAMTAGANGAPLPTADATGGIAMAAGAGKVALVDQATTLGCNGSSTVCTPTQLGHIVDLVGYGNANFFEGSAAVGTLANATAGLRKNNGCTDTNDNAADFATGTPSARNSSSPTFTCPASGLVVTIAPSNSSAPAGGTVNFTVSATNNGSPVAITTASWSSTNTAAATIDPNTGVATTVAAGTTTIGVSVTTASGNGSATTQLTVTAAPQPVATVTVTPATWTLKVNQTRQFSATAKDANGNPVSTTFTWSTNDATIATIDATGLATGKGVGQVTVTATAANNVQGTATLTVNPASGSISIGGRSAPLPVGFQTQLFLTGNNNVDVNGNPVTNAGLTWSSSDPTKVSVDANTGVIKATGAGSAVITATAKSDGVTSDATTITTSTPTFGAGARLGHNTELGTPTDANASDDIIIARRQYTTSYNPSRGVTNWVSWNLDQSHQGSAARCNCFTADTALTRLNLPAYDTNDWINNGTNGQYSRGHMSPSADWLDADGDNAATFFLTNMLPQNQTMNGGPWGAFENYLRSRITATNEIYVISGGIFTPGRGPNGSAGFGTISNAGKVSIPDSIWKIAVIVPDQRSASGITNASQIEVIAINTPNFVPATGAGVWTDYVTTVAKLQTSTGYDFLAALQNTIEAAVEAGDHAPVAHITGAGTSGGAEGTPLAFSASTSTDADVGTTLNDALSYAWQVNGAAVGTGAALNYAFPDNGAYTLRLIATDNFGLADTTSATINITNVAPETTLQGTTPNAPVGGTYNLQVRFRDPGSKDAPWKIVIDWGDGTAKFTTTSLVQTWSAPLTRGHVYAAAGQYTVTVTVTDKNNATTTTTLVVTAQ